MRDQLRELENRKREIASELDASQATSGIALHPNLPELYRRKVGELNHVLHNQATRPQAVDIVRSLMDHIEITPGKRRGQCDIVVVGALAQILAFAQKKTTAASSGDGGTFLMVAGARNHRRLTLPPVPI